MISPFFIIFGSRRLQPAIEPVMFRSLRMDRANSIFPRMSIPRRHITEQDKHSEHRSICATAGESPKASFTSRSF
jgi:hypothetical protein